MTRWKLGQLRNLLAGASNGTTKDQGDPTETTVAVTRIETISGGAINLCKVGYVEDGPELAKYKLTKGDILFSHINSLPVIGNCALVEECLELYAGMNLLRLRPKNTVDARFLHYTLKSACFRDRVEAYAKPAVNQASISKSTLLGLSVSIPPLPTQTAIANYLDRKTAAIDALIEKKERLIEEVRKYQEAVIAEAVAPREGWVRQKIKHLVEPLPKSKRPAGDAEVDGDTTFYVSGQQVKKCFGADHLNSKSVVLATGGTAAIHLAKGSYSYSSDCWALTAKDGMNVDYLWFLLKSKKDQIENIGFRGAGIKHLEKDWLLDLEVFVPSISDQAKISTEVQTKYDLLESSAGNAIQCISYLKAFRSALISEAVTGKLPLPADIQ